MESNTYPEFYQSYIERIPDGDQMLLFQQSIKDTISSLALVSDSQASQSYESSKWTIKDVLQHLIDTERIFCFRALSMARGDTANLKGFDHQKYANQAGANQRSLRSLLEEYKLLRSSTIDLFNSFSPEMLQKSALVDGNKLRTVQIQFIILGHHLHHLEVIQRKYLYP